MTTMESWMEIAATLSALIDTDGHTLPAQVVRDGIEHLIVGCDLGNSAIKLVLRQASAPQLRAFRFEAVYTPAATVRSISVKSNGSIPPLEAPARANTPKSEVTSCSAFMLMPPRPRYCRTAAMSAGMPVTCANWTAS